MFHKYTTKCSFTKAQVKLNSVKVLKTSTLLFHDSFCFVWVCSCIRLLGEASSFAGYLCLQWLWDYKSVFHAVASRRVCMWMIPQALDNVNRVSLLRASDTETASILFRCFIPKYWLWRFWMNPNVTYLQEMERCAFTSVCQSAISTNVLINVLINLYHQLCGIFLPYNVLDTYFSMLVK